MTEWAPGPGRPAADAGEVHLWRVSLGRPVRPLLLSLAADERARAARFHFPRDRRRFIVARGLLRAILGRYLACAPATLRLAYGPQGKPWLAGHPSLTFNLTHAHELALVAVAWERQVGVDLAYVGDRPAEEEALAARFFAPQEVAALQRVPQAARPHAFLQAWTRKEAYAKARGDGLSRPLNRFAVSLAPEAPPALLWDGDDPDAPACWQLLALEPDPAYVAAVAAAGREWQARCWTY